MTVPSGNSSFPENLIVSRGRTEKTLRFEGNKINPFPRAQSALSYLLYSPRRKTFSRTNAKENCFCDKERKNLFIYVNTVSNNLNFAL